MQLEKGTGLLRASLGVLVLAGSAFAQEPAPPPAGSTSVSDSGFSFGLRSGYAVPLGNVTGAPAGATAPNLSDTISGAIPIWADIGYRFTPNWYLGGFYQYGIGILPSNSCTGGSCSEWDMRFGLNVHYHFMPGEMLDPWVGLGAGYEIFNLNASGGGASASVQLRGFEFGNAQVGLDWMVMPNLGVGPFVAFSVAQYSDSSTSGTIPGFGAFGQSGSITNKGIHEWLIFGLRGVFNLNM